MLRSLKIKNYALIDEVSIEFDQGLTIITGETGAGKSILIGALGLLTGNRADTSVLRDKESKCVVEGIFNISKYNLKKIFDQNDLDYDEVTIIRREISPNGRSRAFINDTPVNVSTLKEIAERLIDIHSQHDTLLLNQPTYQLDVIDAFAGNGKLRDEYSTQYYKYSKIRKQLEELKEKAAKEKADYDYLQYQFDQLEQANLKEGEQEELEAEQQQLSHTEEIKNALGEINMILTDEENGVTEQIRMARKAAEQITEYFPKAQELYNRLDSVFIELQDLAGENEVLFNDLEFDPERLEIINDRLDKIYELQHKFNVTSVKELLELKDEFEQKLLQITSYDEEIAKLEQQTLEEKQKLDKLAGELSQSRQKVKALFEQSIEGLLKQLGMPNTTFFVDIEQTDLTETGQDKIVFYFSANKKVEAQPIAKVASGGELSRLMLAIKYIVSRSKVLPTIIFDEIDTGISGEIAAKVGQMIKQLSKNLQVIDITHLPQIAAKADTHILVYKEDREDGTISGLRKLNAEERVEEIAKMLSGESITSAALEHARQLIGS